MTQPKLKPGDRLGMLTVVERAGSARYGTGGHCRSRWRLRCDCGAEIERSSANLGNGKKHNCGCWSGGHARGRAPANQSHNMSTTNLYAVWLSMKGRCYRPKAQSFHNYGGRGIYVCDEWRGDFRAFSDWCKANGHGPGLQLDRIDNDGPYAPWNCRLVTRAAGH